MDRMAILHNNHMKDMVEAEDAEMPLEEVASLEEYDQPFSQYHKSQSNSSFLTVYTVISMTHYSLLFMD